MFGIVISVIAIVCCGFATILSLKNADYLSAFGMFLLCLLNVFLLCYHIDNYKHKDEPEMFIVKDVSNYKVDSTIVINGVDTTKTYVLTYWN